MIIMLIVNEQTFARQTKYIFYLNIKASIMVIYVHLYFNIRSMYLLTTEIELYID